MTKKDKSVKKSPNLRFPGFEEEWELETLGNISLNIMYGINAAATTYDGKNKYIRITDIDEKTRLFKPNPLCSPKGKLESKYLLNEGDILFTRTGASVGKSYLYNKSDGNTFFAGFLIRFSIHNNNPYFIFSQTLTNDYEKWVLSMSMRSGQPGINAEEYKSLPIQTTIIEEQNKIANFLFLLDSRIECSMKTIENLESLKSSLLNKIFKRKNEFYKNKNWEERQLAQISHEHQDKNKKNLHNEVFSVAKNKGVINQIEHLGRSFSASDISNYKLIYPGDLVYTKSPTSDFPFGIIKQNRTNRIGVVSPLYCVFTPQSFALGYLIHEYFESAVNTFNYLNPLVQKGAKNTMNINNDTFLNGAELFLPIGEREQGKLYKLFSSINQKIEIELRILEKLNQQKKYFLQNLFI